jgi:hypothetical protein
MEAFLMLVPKSTWRKMQEDLQTFNEAYLEILEKMRSIMVERGKVRDTSTPIYYRRDPSECTGLAKNKILRANSQLEELDHENPEPRLLEGIIEECVDASNYLIFVAALCSRILEEQEDTDADSTH